MRAEDELQFMMDFYPDLFPTRKHCLDHLFCVIGNGYQWIDGELVDNDDEYHKRYQIVEHIKRAKGKNEEYFYKCMDEEKKKNEECFYKRMDEEIRLKSILKENYKQRFGDMKYNFSWYPLSKKYSYLYNYPENIKPDWLSILNECKQLLEADGIKIED